MPQQQRFLLLAFCICHPLAQTSNQITSYGSTDTANAKIWSCFLTICFIVMRKCCKFLCICKSFPMFYWGYPDHCHAHGFQIRRMNWRISNQTIAKSSITKGTGNIPLETKICLTTTVKVSSKDVFGVIILATNTHLLRVVWLGVVVKLSILCYVIIYFHTYPHTKWFAASVKW